MRVIAFGAILLTLFVIGRTVAQDDPIKRSPAVAIPTSWVLYEKQNEGFRIALPPSWREIIMDPMTRETAIKTMKENSRQAAAIAKNIDNNRLLSESGFYASDTAPDVTIGSGSPSKINVIKVHLGERVSLDYFIQVNVRKMENNPGIEEPVLHRLVILPAGVAAEIRFRMRTDYSGQTWTESFIQYAFIRGKDVYLVTLGTDGKNAERFTPIFDKIANSFHFTE